jgi:hypothetical protein
MNKRPEYSELTAEGMRDAKAHGIDGVADVPSVRRTTR